MIEQADRRPMYRRLRDQIAIEIAQNRWAPGAAIASESELATAYNLSIGTVRKAIDCLVGDGLVERIHGSGTFVRRPDFSHAFIRFTQVYGSAGDTRAPDSRILKRETMVGPQAVTEALQLEAGAQVIRMLRLRIHDSVPVMHEEIWLDAALFAPILTMADQQPKLLYPVYEDLCGQIVAKVLETITIDTVNQADQDLIALQAGCPVVCIERLAVRFDDFPIEWRHSRSSAQNFRYKVEIR